MLDAVPPQLLTGGGLAGLLSLAVWLILTGRLVPRSTVDALLAGKDQEIARLAEAHALEVQRGDLQAEHLGELLEHARTTTQVIRSLPRPERQGSP